MDHFDDDFLVVPDPSKAHTADQLPRRQRYTRQLLGTPGPGATNWRPSAAVLSYLRHRHETWLFVMAETILSSPLSSGQKLTACAMRTTIVVHGMLSGCAFEVLT
jgi:hypothetical protein